MCMLLFSIQQGLTIEDLEDLLVDIKVYMELEEGKNAEFWKVDMYVAIGKIHSQVNQVLILNFLLLWGIFWILTCLSPLSWVSESFRQDIGQFQHTADYYCPNQQYLGKVCSACSRALANTLQIYSLLFITKPFTRFQLGKSFY